VSGGAGGRSALYHSIVHGDHAALQQGDERTRKRHSEFEIREEAIFEASAQNGPEPICQVPNTAKRLSASDLV
jgi:hypothetical protein